MTVWIVAGVGVILYAYVTWICWNWIIGPPQEPTLTWLVRVVGGPCDGNVFFDRGEVSLTMPMLRECPSEVWNCNQEGAVFQEDILGRSMNHRYVKRGDTFVYEGVKVESQVTPENTSGGVNQY